MPTETKLPDAILEQSGWTTTPAVTSIDEDPDSPGSDWIIAASTTADPIVRVSFPTPTGYPDTGTQTFKMYVRKQGGTGTPTARIDLYENGSLLSSGADQNVTSATGQLLSQNFSDIASLLTDKSGATVEARFVVVHAGGSPGARASVDLNAINWDTVSYSTGIPYTDSATVPFDLQSSGSDIAEFVGSATVTLKLTPSVTATFSVGDDFNRADETPLGNGVWTKPAWVTGGYWTIFNQRAITQYSNLDCFDIYTGREWANDQSSKAKLYITGSTGGSAGVGLCVRTTSGATRGLYWFVTDHAASNNCNIRRFDAASSASLDTFTEAWTNGDTFELTVTGAPGNVVLTVYRNGSQIRQVTDTDATNGKASGYPGLAFSSTDTGPQADDWVGTDLTGAGEFVEFVDAPTVLLTLQASGTDEYTPGTQGQEYTDSATDQVYLTPSAIEIHEITDASIVSLTLTPSTADIAIFIDAATPLVDLQSSGEEVKAHDYDDADTSLVDLQASGTDEHVQGAVEYTDSATDQVFLQPSGADAAEFVDSAIPLTGLEASGTESREITDSETAQVYLVPSSTEIREIPDEATITFIMSASATEEHEIPDSATATALLTPSATEEHATYDTGEALVDLQASGTDEQALPTYEYTDEATTTVAIFASGADILEAVDASDVLVDIQASSAEIAEFVDADTTLLDLSTSSTDVFEATDEATVALLLTPESVEYMPQILRPNADIDANDWQVAPLWEKLSDMSNATYIYATAA